MKMIKEPETLVARCTKCGCPTVVIYNGLFWEGKCTGCSNNTTLTKLDTKNPVYKEHYERQKQGLPMKGNR